MIRRVTIRWRDEPWPTERSGRIIVLVGSVLWLAFVIAVFG